MYPVILILKAIKSRFRRFVRAVRRGFRHPEPGETTADDLVGFDAATKFTRVYEGNIFGGSVSRSGEGSTLQRTEIIRRTIPQLLADRNIRTMLDAPCGDWHWMKATKLPVERYIGADIVPHLIEINRQAFGSDRISFTCLDIRNDDLPRVDLILCRDCLVHLSYADARAVLKNFKRSGAYYILTTTFESRRRNRDLGTTFWRPLNLQVAPFNFPAPLAVLNEGSTESDGAFTDKSLGLWAVKDIQV